MYFSRISLINKDLRQATRSIHALLRADSYKHHQLLWKFFPNRPDDQRDFLFRFMENEKCFYVLSPYIPKEPDAGWEVKHTPYEPMLSRDTRLSFELRVNPVVKHQRDGKEKRDDIVMHAKIKIAEQLGLIKWADVPQKNRKPLYEIVFDAGKEWLTKSGQRLGFEIESESLQVNSYLQHYLRKNEKEIRYSTLDFNGILTVTDPEKFKGQALFKGIGPAKAFGCGLMLVRRI